MISFVVAFTKLFLQGKFTATCSKRAVLNRKFLTNICEENISLKVNFSLQHSHPGFEIVKLVQIFALRFVNTECN